jgi:hypothetical protein
MIIFVTDTELPMSTSRDTREELGDITNKIGMFASTSMFRYATLFAMAY